MAQTSKQIQDEIGDCAVNYFEQGDNEEFFKKHSVIIGFSIGVFGIAVSLISFFFNP